MRRVRVPRQGITNLRDKGHRVVEIGRIERERKRWGHEGEEKRRKERMHSLKPPCKYLLVERVASRKNSLCLPLSLSLSSSSFIFFHPTVSFRLSLSLSPPSTLNDCLRCPSYHSLASSPPLFRNSVSLLFHRGPAGIADCIPTWKICLREKRARRSSRPSLFSNFSETDK